MRRLTIFALWASTTLGMPAPAMAATDYVCVNNCQQAGYMFQYCQSRCSYGTGTSGGQPFMGQQQGILPNLGGQRPLSTDFQCMSDCTALGYAYRLCKTKCSY